MENKAIGNIKNSIQPVSGPILAFDSALGGCVVAVMEGETGQIHASRSLETAREQAALLVPMIQDTLKEAGLTFADLSLLVTSIGPGSFTGLRIGLSAARSLALALEIPLVGVGTLDALMQSCAPVITASHKRRVCLVESKRSDYYVRFYDAQGREEGEPFCALAEDILAAITPAETVLCGDAVERFLTQSGVERQSFAQIAERAMLDPAALLMLGLEDFRTRSPKEVKVEPLYLRGADVSYSQKKQREIADCPL